MLLCRVRPRAELVASRETFVHRSQNCVASGASQRARLAAAPPLIRWFSFVGPDPDEPKPPWQRRTNVWRKAASAPRLPGRQFCDRSGAVRTGRVVAGPSSAAATATSSRYQRMNTSGCNRAATRRVLSRQNSTAPRRTALPSCSDLAIRLAWPGLSLATISATTQCVAQSNKS